MSNVYTLATLNTLRVKNNMAPLKAWKESKAKLEAAIGKLTTKADPVAKELKATSVAKAKPAKPTKVAKEKVAKEPKDNSLSISTIAEGLDIDPKVARAKMRRAFGKKEEGKWPNTVAEIKKVLSGDSRKKEA